MRTSRFANPRGFAWIIIPIVLAATFAVAVLAQVHVPLLNPQTKVTAAKVDRGSFEALKAFQTEEERLWHTHYAPLEVKDAAGHTLHYRIAVEIKAIDEVLRPLTKAILAMPVGGTLGVKDLGFVTQLATTFQRLLAVASPALGSSLGSAMAHLTTTLQGLVSSVAPTVSITGGK